MLSDAMAGLNAAKTAYDMVRSLKDVTDETARAMAIIDIQRQLLETQAAQAELVKRAESLETELKKFQDWDVQRNRYVLRNFGGETFAYELKADAISGEPPHRICPICYENRRRSILQFYGRLAHGGRDRFDCKSCKTEFQFGEVEYPSAATVRVRQGDWWDR